MEATYQPAPSSIKQPKRADKTWVKDMVLTQSPRFSSVPKFHVRERLYENKFVLSGFILHSLATEKELRKTSEAAFVDKFAFTPQENRFEFVRAVEKQIVKIRSTDGITGEVFKHFCGSQGLIYIRSTTDLTVIMKIFLNKKLIVTSQPLMSLRNFLKSQWRNTVWSVQISSFFSSKCGKTRTRKNSVFGHFSRSGSYCYNQNSIFKY